MGRYFANKYADILKNEELYKKVKAFTGPGAKYPMVEAEEEVFFRRRGPGGFLALLKRIREVPQFDEKNQKNPNYVGEDDSYDELKQKFNNLYLEDPGMDWWLLDVYLNLENISA